jgi:hypothetical protein
MEALNFKQAGRNALHQDQLVGDDKTGFDV